MNPKDVNVEVPGIDIDSESLGSGNVLSNKGIQIRFTIINQFSGNEYQEYQNVTTDEYGLINVVIGKGVSLFGVFSEIDWNAEPRNLKVEMNYESSGYIELSNQPLYFTPYAYHRNITATGTLDVDRSTNLNDTLNVNNQSPVYLSGSLDVEGVTNLNDTLAVNNQSPTYLSGSLDVDGFTNLNNTLVVSNQSPTYLSGTLDVDGITNLNDTLAVNNQSPTYLSGTLDVDGVTNLMDTVDIYGQVTINANILGAEDQYNSYPLRIEGSDHGIAIKVNSPRPNNGNNFITFFDQAENAVGRIEGQTSEEVASSPDYAYETAILTAEEIAAGVNVGLASLPTCVGGVIVSCGVSASSIAMAAADLVLATANLVSYQIYAFANLGVTYESGSADYAEWLERAVPNEAIFPAEIVGVRAGKISKYTDGAEQLMVTSTKPALLGNMPDENRAHLYNKIAFMGQVPVKVRGIVLNGDYILPSGNNDGTGVAVSPDEITYDNYNRIVGIAWSESIVGKDQISLINMAIGLNPNAISKLVAKQEKKYLELEARLEVLEKRSVAGTESDKHNFINDSVPKNAIESKGNVTSRYQTLVENMPPELSQEIFEEAFNFLLASYKGQGIDVSKHEGLNKLFNDPVYKTEIIEKAKKNYKLNYQEIIKRARN